MAVRTLLAYTFPVAKACCEWDPEKDLAIQLKHGIAFKQAQFAFLDPRRVIAKDLTHSTKSEHRYYCFGCVGNGVLTERFTYRREIIRIIGAGYWRKGQRVYEKQNQI